MKRFHVHVGVTDLSASVHFYSALFGAEPTIHKPDYAKWMMDNPRVNFAISTRTGRNGLDHLGIQVENDIELTEVGDHLKQASTDVVEQKGTACCYAEANKYWVQDPAGIAWEAFNSLGSVPVFGEQTKPAEDSTEGQSACCAPGLGKMKSAEKNSACC